MNTKRIAAGDVVKVNGEEVVVHMVKRGTVDMFRTQTEAQGRVWLSADQIDAPAEDAPALVWEDLGDGHENAVGPSGAVYRIESRDRRVYAYANGQPLGHRDAAADAKGLAQTYEDTIRAEWLAEHADDEDHVEPNRDDLREQAIEQARQEAPTADERLASVRDRLRVLLVELDAIADGDPEEEATAAAASAASRVVTATSTLDRHLGPRCRHCGVPITWTASTFGGDDFAWRHDRGDGAASPNCTDNLGRPLASGTVAEPTE
jgi:hypothetical protein